MKNVHKYSCLNLLKVFRKEISNEFNFLGKI